MMAWYQILLFFFTNGLRIFIGLYLVTTLLKLSGNMRKAGILFIGAAAFVTVLSCFSIPQLYIIGIEIIILILGTHYLFMAKPRMCLFIMIFYEMAVALWEFIISAGLCILFQSKSFLDAKTIEYMVAVWVVRLLMLGVVFLAIKGHASKSEQPSLIISAVAIAGLFGVILIHGQSIIPISDSQMVHWLIYSMLIPLAILFFNLNRQYELEITIARLEMEKNALLERDYQTLSDTYATNAKLFHDFHNHIDVLHRYLTNGSTAEAINYLEDLRTPIQTIMQTVWVGDEAVDYLINSKIANAISKHILVNTNIEFPRHTKIRSVDLVAILGNLLDNALEATENTADSLRFINLTIRRINDMLVIKVENGCNITPAVNDGNLQTSKTDKNLHGWGLKSARTVAEHYDGTIETEYSKNTFRTVVTLSFEAVKAQ